MNEVILIGILATEPEMRETKTKVPVCNFRLAVKEEFKNPESGERETDFFTIVAWRQLAELCVKYLSKGKKIAMIGHMKPRCYEGKDGVKRYDIDIVMDSMEFLSPKDTRPNGNAYGQEGYPAEDYGLLPDDGQTPF